MSTVSDLIKRPQCGTKKPSSNSIAGPRGEETLCTPCGYRESLLRFSELGPYL